MKNVFVLILFILSFNSIAVVKRHDVPASSYELIKTPDFYIDMPYEGTGVLIDTQWILAPAHVLYFDYHDKPILIHGVKNRIEKVILHTVYEKESTDWGQGDSKPLMDYLNSHHDIALIKLAAPVAHVKPVSRYYGNEEVSMEITVFGKGATGTGLTGEIRHTKRAGSWERFVNWVKSPFTDLAPTQQKRTLNRYNNIIESVDDMWARFRFNKGDEALALEGTVGSGDSGGPAIIMQKNIPLLVGLASWTEVDGDLKDFVSGKYDSVAVFVRVSAYNSWIDSTISEHE